MYNLDKDARKRVDIAEQTIAKQARKLYEFVEQLETRVAELRMERDEYDARRREAMEKVEEWRGKCHALEDRIKEFERNQVSPDECPTCAKWKNSRLPMVCTVRDLRITIDRDYPEGDDVASE